MFSDKIAYGHSFTWADLCIIATDSKALGTPQISEFPQ